MVGPTPNSSSGDAQVCRPVASAAPTRPRVRSRPARRHTAARTKAEETGTIETQVHRTDSGLVYDVRGRGPTTLLLLHGGSARRQWFDEMSALLADEVRMVVPDLPGHGESPARRGAYRLEDSAAAAAEVLDHSGVGRCWVVGHSHGAHVGAVLAADRPDLVSGLVVGDAPMSRERMRAHLTATAAMNRAWRALTDDHLSDAAVRDGLLDVEVPTPAASSTLGSLFGRDHPYIREMVTCLRHHDGDFLDAVLLRFDDTYRRLDDDLLGRLEVPVTMLQADPAAGGLLTDDDVEFVRARVPHVRVEFLPGVGHGLQSQDPALVADALRRTVSHR